MKKESASYYCYVISGYRIYLTFETEQTSFFFLVLPGSTKITNIPLCHDDNKNLCV